MQNTLTIAPDWGGLSLTKFRAPRMRRNLVARPALLARLRELAVERQVTVVCAPAGFGKSTLLLQLLDGLGGAAEAVWLALDDDDNDINRLFVSLLGALHAVALEWAVDPQHLATYVNQSGHQARTAVAAVANALCSYGGERLLLVVDDLHHVTDPDALQLLADLIERLPPEVGVVLASRVEPVLPLARWRARSELGEVLLADLQFSSDEAQTLAGLNAEGRSPLSPQLVEQAWQRTQGWVAGLSLVFGVTSGELVEQMQAAVDRAASRHLYNFFAEEVLGELPADVAAFVLDCAVLPELTPELCRAVSGRDDARALLEELYRRNLFLTALDDIAPVLRFHDLFAEFLYDRLERLHPARVAELHARAAAAEHVPLRAVNHWLRARRWDEAVAAIAACIEALLDEGSQALVQRWLAQLPADYAQDRPDVLRLQALCAWSGWDFHTATGLLERACAGFQAEGREREYLRHFAQLPRAYNAVGMLPEAERALAKAAALPLDEHSQAIYRGGEAWQCMAAGRPEGVAPALTALVALARRDPKRLVPSIDDMFNSFLFSAPGTLDALTQLRELCRAQLGRPHSGRGRLTQPGVSWQVEAFAHISWPEFWRGERAAVRAVVAAQTALQERLSTIPMLQLNARQAEALEAAAAGDLARAIDCSTRGTAVFDSIDIAGLTGSWRRATVYITAHFHWMAQDVAGLQSLWPTLGPARRPEEWPFVDTGRAQLRGHLALLAHDYAAAETCYLEAERLQRRWPMQTFFGDVRMSLAWCHCVQGHRDEARAAFAPVLALIRDTDCIWPLLTAPINVVDGLLALLSAAELQALQPWLQRWAGWRDDDVAVAPDDEPAALRQLSAREREVLARIARGDSNKLIARALDLSPHTVKRHVANILTKLDCDTRGQAAALWRDAPQSASNPAR